MTKIVFFYFLLPAWSFEWSQKKVTISIFDLQSYLGMIFSQMNYEVKCRKWNLVRGKVSWDRDILLLLDIKEQLRWERYRTNQRRNTIMSILQNVLPTIYHSRHHCNSAQKTKRQSPQKSLPRVPFSMSLMSFICSFINVE